MSKKKSRVFSPELKVSVVKRMLGGEETRDLARELKVSRTFLYRWKDIYRKYGAGGFRRRRGRPAGGGHASESVAERSALSAAQKRVAELERKIGQQQVELDFFQQALRRVRANRQTNDGNGAKAFTPSSKR
jgi:transposase-like protein